MDLCQENGLKLKPNTMKTESTIDMDHIRYLIREKQANEPKRMQPVMIGNAEHFMEVDPERKPELNFERANRITGCMETWRIEMAERPMTKEELDSLSLAPCVEESHE